MACFTSNENQHTPAQQEEIHCSSPAGNPKVLGLGATLTDHTAGYHTTAAQVTTHIYYILII